MIAGPRTEQWADRDSAPLIMHRVRGDFEAEVKVTINPVGTFQYAGLGIRSSTDPLTYVRAVRGIGLLGQGLLMQSCNQGYGYHGNDPKYSGATVWFKIRRRGSIFNFLYSSNGNDWVSLQKDYKFDLPDEVDVYLVTYSTNNGNISAQFEDFIVTSQ